MTINWIDIKDELPPIGEYIYVILHKDYDSDVNVRIARYIEMVHTETGKKNSLWHTYESTNEIFSTTCVQAWARIDIPERYR